MLKLGHVQHGKFNRNYIPIMIDMKLRLKLGQKGGSSLKKLKTGHEKHSS